MADDNENNEYTPDGQFESKTDLVIGIDFGTTFSGVAYANPTKVNASKLFTRGDKTTVASEIVQVIRAWPGAAQLEKIPSQLSYKNPTTPIWGSKVKTSEDYEPRIAHFKLGLEENVKDHYNSDTQGRRQSGAGKGSPLGGYLTDPNWTHPLLREMKAVDYAADYLTAVCNYVTSETLPRHFGKQFLERQKISYVITVPAIWSDKAKDLTRQAAQRAGIPRRKLVLITEPEAAALYCATFCKEVDLEPGDRFLVCDAGGGTVVSNPSEIPLTKNRILYPTRFLHFSLFLSKNAALAQALPVALYISTWLSKIFSAGNLEAKLPQSSPPKLFLRP
jgi:molecular chaperone DnaK (HSP70)